MGKKTPPRGIERGCLKSKGIEWVKNLFRSLPTQHRKPTLTIIIYETYCIVYGQWLTIDMASR
jgi:hypothetical protein